MAAANRPLDLSRPRPLGELLATTVELFLRHSGLFLSVTLLVVAPYVVLVDGVWGRQLRDGPAAHVTRGVSVASLLLAVLVVPPLVTGLHAVIVRSIGKGFVPAIGEALGELAPRVPAAFGAVVLYATGAAIGFLLLIGPGVWLSVRWYFAAQAAVLDEASPRASLGRSAKLVDGNWAWTFATLLLSGVLFGGVGGIAQLALEGLHQPVAYVAARTVVQAVVLSLTALFGTLLFFTLRAQQDPPDTLLDAPERVA